MTDNIDRIQQKITPNTVVLLAADILRLKDTIDALYVLTKDMGEAVCVNSEALKEIINVLAANDFFTDNASEENSELDLVGRFDVWCDVTKHLNQAFVKHKESTKVDLSVQRERWNTQNQTNKNLLVEIDNCRSRIDALMAQHKGLQATLTELVDAIKKSEVAKND